ncbi:MAG: hypothetical protein ACRCVT_08065 [Leadbetterella sp.]
MKLSQNSKKKKYTAPSVSKLGKFKNLTFKTSSFTDNGQAGLQD